MDRIPILSGGFKSSGDVIRVIGVDGKVYAPMTIAEAKAFAKQERAEMVHLATGQGMIVFKLVKKASKKRLRKKR